MADQDNVREFKPRKRKGGGNGGDAGPPGPPSGAPPWEPPAVEGCPVMPLGHRGGRYWFFSRVGELRSCTAHELTSQAGLLSLFEGRTDWLTAHFAQLGRKGRATGEFDPAAAGQFLIDACADPEHAGLFDPTLPQRGPGIWRDRDGGLIVHAGTYVSFRGAWQRAGLKRDEAVYPAAPAVAPPAKAPAPATTGQRLLEHLRRWRFEQDTGPELVAGWIGQALLGAAPSWRVHAYVVGERGSGKSWLAGLVHAALGGGAHPMLNNFSEAGLRQAFTGEARALVLDEAEHDPASSRVRFVIELLRQMSGGEGARALRGSAGGQAMGFQVTGCAYLSSILHVPLLPADRSRILVLRLLDLPTGADQAEAAAAVSAAVRELEAASPELRARAVQGWPRFQRTLAAYRKAFMSLGMDPRMADSYGALLAGRDLLIADAVPDEDAAYDEACRFGGLMERAAIDREEGEGQSCLNRLYTSAAELWRAGDRCTVAQLVMDAVKEYATTPAGAGGRRPLGAMGQKLGAAGLRIAEDAAGEWVLLVANQHVGLERLFDGTRWRDGAWQQALHYLPGARAWPKPERFAGALSRATMVPNALLPREVEEDARPPQTFDEAAGMS